MYPRGLGVSVMSLLKDIQSELVYLLLKALEPFNCSNFLLLPHITGAKGGIFKETGLEC